jgi:hypothetical protein
MARFNRGDGLRALRRAALFSVLIIVFGVLPAWASHFRFAHISWVPRTDLAPTAVEITVTLAVRRSGYSGSHPDGNPRSGDSILETISNTEVEFGDGTFSGTLTIDVTAFSVAQDWFIGQAVLLHTYPSAQSYLAAIDTTARISMCDAPNSHLNNPDPAGYRIETLIDVGTGNGSPVISLPPIVRCVQGQICSFQIPAFDEAGDPLSFRLSSFAESMIANQPGVGANCTGGIASISSGGVYTWDPTGCNLGTVVCGAGFSTLYSTQVTVEEAPGGGKSAVDFFIELVQCQPGNNVPIFDGATPPCGSTVAAAAGVPVSFTVQASDADAGENVVLNSGAIPLGVVMNAALPLSGDPVSSVFNWTPGAGDVGQHIVSFTAEDPCGAQTICPITVDVVAEICDNSIDDDSDSLVDCADPDCVAALNCQPTPTPDLNPTPTPTHTPRFPVDLNFVLRKVRLKANRATNPGITNARVGIKGILSLNPPLEGFAGDIVNSGITVSFQGAGVSDSLPFSGSECSSQGVGKIICKTPTGDRKLKLRPGPSKYGPEIFQIKVLARGRDFTAPLVLEPVAVTLGTINNDLTDTIGETGTCSVRGAEEQKVICNEPKIIR